MWVVFLDNESQSALLRAAFLAAGYQYESIVTSFGGLVSKSQNPEQSPHLAILPPEKTKLKNLFDWVHLNLNPNLIISSGVCTPCNFEGQSERILIPAMCLRSAGRVDVGGPVLFEEILFEPHQQKVFSEELKIEASGGKLFSAEKIRSDRETHEWIQKHLDCQCTDSFSGELLLMSKRVSVRTACIKAVAADDNQAAKVLAQAWTQLLPMKT